MASRQDQDKDFLDIDLDDALKDAPELEKASVTEPAKDMRKTGTGVLLYEGKKYAVGLRWLVAEDDGDVDLATKRAKSFNADFYCMRQNVASQHGFGYLSMGHRVTMPVLAASVGDMLVGEWHGVFVADNGWWYMAVHADNIAPEGDWLFASEEEAYNHFISQTEGHHWPRSYAPESWNIPGSSGEVPLSKIIDEIIGSTPTLRAVTLDAVFSGKTNKNLALGAGGIIFLLLIFSMLSQEFIPSLIPTQAQLPIPNIQVSEDLQTPPKEPSLVDMEQASDLMSFRLMRPSEMVERCLSGFSKTTVPLPGWDIDTIRCKETFVETIWLRKLGSLHLVEPYLNRFPKEVTRAMVDTGTLLARYSIASKSPGEKTQTLLTEGTARAVLSRRFENIGAMTMAVVKPAASEQLLASYDSAQEASLGSLGGNKALMTPITPNDLPYLDVTIKGVTPPNMLINYFDIPGLSIVTIEGRVARGEWQYDLKLILKPETRLIEANIKAKAMQIR